MSWNHDLEIVVLGGLVILSGAFLVSQLWVYAQSFVGGHEVVAGLATAGVLATDRVLERRIDKFFRAVERRQSLHARHSWTRFLRRRRKRRPG